jgi:FixJ family two-component response regulator
MKSNVYILDADRELRSSLRPIFEKAGHTVCEFATGQSFLNDVEEFVESSRCLILEVALPDISGIELQVSLWNRNLRIPIVMISGCASAQLAVRAMQNGAITFLIKPLPLHELLDSVEHALAKDYRRTIFRQRLRLLSSRERDVLVETLSAKSPKQIASELGIGVKTVHKHRAQVLRKMGVKSDIELALRAQTADYWRTASWPETDELPDFSTEHLHGRDIELDWHASIAEQLAEAVQSRHNQ